MIHAPQKAHRKARGPKRLTYEGSLLQRGWVVTSFWLRRMLRPWIRLLGWHMLWSRSRRLVRFKTSPVRGNLKAKRPFGEVDWNVINLLQREDRLEEIRCEMAKMDASWNRIDAIGDENGALGCARSHLEVLRAAHAQQLRIPLAIAEDDLLFTASPHEVSSVIADFLANPLLDILCLSHRTRGFTFPVSTHLRVANEIFTTSAYISKPHAIPELIKAFETSVRMLSQGIRKEHAAIDVVWQETQLKRLLFAVPRRSLARQRPSYSDVAHKYADYEY